jgi:predicted DNA-binding protein
MPRMSVFVEPVAVSAETAERLAAIALLEGQTLACVIRNALERYADGCRVASPADPFPGP